MPRSPCSLPPDTCEDKSRNGVVSRLPSRTTRILPPFSAMNQREASPGGPAKSSGKERPLTTCSSITLLVDGTSSEPPPPPQAKARTVSTDPSVIVCLRIEDQT